MKSIQLLYGSLWVLLLVKCALSIKCYSCDSYNDESVTCNETALSITDCSLDHEFGESFDSCFIMTVDHGNRKEHIYANCSMSFGCEELEQLLCEQYEEGNTSINNRCTVECCTEDLCNKVMESSAYSTLRSLGVGLVIYALWWLPILSGLLTA